MSALSDLEKELGLDSLDYSLLYEDLTDKCDGIQIIPSQPASDIVTEDLIKAKFNAARCNSGLVGIKETDAWEPNSRFDPAIVAKSMSIPIINVTNLYLSCLDVYRRTDDVKIKYKAKEILIGLYQNNITREKCNELVKELNELRGC